MTSFVSGAVTLAIDCRNELGEMPLWDGLRGMLYWIDVTPGRVFHWKVATRAVGFWQFDGLVTGLNHTSDGKLLVNRKSDILCFDPHTQETQPLFALPASGEDLRFNDGRCDARGRLWVGTMQNNIGPDGASVPIREYVGDIRMVDAIATQAFAARLGCPNGMCWSPDGTTLYVADSCDGGIYAYGFDLATPSLSDRHLLCRLSDLGIPDGAAVDRDGFIWNARWGAGALARISPDGRLDRVVRVPALQPTGCCFGGEDLRTLYVTSARFGLTAEQLAASPSSGGVFSIRVEVAGLEPARFALRESHENHGH